MNSYDTVREFVGQVMADNCVAHILSKLQRLRKITQRQAGLWRTEGFDEYGEIGFDCRYLTILGIGNVDLMCCLKHKCICSMLNQRCRYFKNGHVEYYCCFCICSKYSGMGFNKMCYHYQ